MDERKRIAGEKAAEWVRDGMVLGLGTGSTTYFALRAIGDLVDKGYDLVGVPTSRSTEELAREFDIPLTTLDEVGEIDLTIDGADEVDPDKRLIKGMGGALLREKIVASASREEIIVVDDSKLVDLLGTVSKLPVEVIPFGHANTRKMIESLGCVAELRGGRSPFITDNGNLIYDCRFDGIDRPSDLEAELNIIPGVIENGLFLKLATRIIIAREGGVETRE